MPATHDQVEALYLAYFGRPADPDGLAYYLSHPELDIWDIAKNFSASPESQALYGKSFGPGVIDAIYQNLFGRHAEPDGLAYWSGEVAAGRLSAAGAAFAILLGAQNQDLDTVDAKLAASAAFTDSLAATNGARLYSGSAAAAFARSFIGSVDPAGLSAAAAIGLLPLELQTMETEAQANAANTLMIIAEMTTKISQTLSPAKPNLLAAQGIKLNNTATVHGMTSGAEIELAGATVNATLATELRTDTAADSLLLKLHRTYTDNEDSVSTYTQHAITLRSPGVESLHIESTGTLSGTADVENPDGVANYVWLNDTSLKQIVATGNQPLFLASETGADHPLIPNLQVVDASQLKAAAGIDDGTGTTYGFTFLGSPTSPLDLIVGAKDSSNYLGGSEGANKIVGGRLDDLIYGGFGNDTLTGGGGHDRFTYDIDMIDAGQGVDEITDFVANTVGQGASGAATATGAVASEAARNGDVIDLSWFGLHRIWVDVAANDDFAMQHLSAAKAAGGYDIYAELDSSSGMLHVAFANPSIAGERIQLDGVTTIGTPAFLLSPNAH